MMQTDVKAVYKASTGQLGIGAVGGTRVRIKGIYAATPVGAGSVTIRDGGSTAVFPILLQFDTAAVIEDFFIPIPGEGILFQADPHVTLTSVTSVTVFYG
jgi:hypothetical protein